MGAYSSLFPRGGKDKVRLGKDKEFPSIYLVDQVDENHCPLMGKLLRYALGKDMDFWEEY